ncbi:MAG: hypothetical protein ABFS22_00970 [Pseudomonadota bacterium]
MKMPDYKLLTRLLLLSALTGCASLDSVRFGQDRPEDLQTLMGQQEYARAGELLDTYPQLDTPERRQQLQERITAYENTILDAAQAEAGNKNLVGAIGILDDGLQKVPENTRIQFYRGELDSKRTARLQENERQKLMARARFLLDEQKLYNEQLNLDAPTFTERWENSRNQSEVRQLHGELLECGNDKLDMDELDAAEECLRLASDMENTGEISAALTRLESERKSERTIEARQARVIKVKQQRTLKKKYINKTQKLVEKTETALDEDDLVTARVTFNKIPNSTRSTKRVKATATRLNTVIAERVDKLIANGDRQYRADNVTAAIKTWNKAREIDPDNNEINERLERANKVLARLEVLKSKQK